MNTLHSLLCSAVRPACDDTWLRVWLNTASNTRAPPLVSVRGREAGGRERCKVHEELCDRKRYGTQQEDDDGVRTLLRNSSMFSSLVREKEVLDSK